MMPHYTFDDKLMGDMCRELALRKSRIKESIITQMVQEFIGDECPKNPADMAQVIIGRGYEFRSFVLPSGTEIVSILNGRDIVASRMLPA